MISLATYNEIQRLLTAGKMLYGGIALYVGVTLDEVRDIAHGKIPEELKGAVPKRRKSKKPRQNISRAPSKPLIPPRYLPLPEEIEQQRRDIFAQWSMQKRLKRREWATSDRMYGRFRSEEGRV